MPTMAKVRHSHHARRHFYHHDGIVGCFGDFHPFVIDDIMKISNNFSNQIFTAKR
jgi:hypothetical protein